METAFMVFGLGFFLYVMHLTNRDEQIRYQRWLNEAREFGYRPPTKKRRFRRNR